MNFLEFIKKNKFRIILIITLFTGAALASYLYIFKQPEIQIQKTEFQFSRPDARPDEIKGEIITLKRLRPEYFKDYHQMISYDIVTKPLYYPSKPSFEFIKNRLIKELKREVIGDTFLYMIFDNKDNRLIGSAEIREKNPKDPGQFSCWMNPGYWGGNRFNEAVKLITQEYFKVKKTPSFNAHVEQWNLRSVFALQKAGFHIVNPNYKEQGQKPRYILEFYNPNLNPQK